MAEALALAAFIKLQRRGEGVLINDGRSINGVLNCMTFMRHITML